MNAALPGAGDGTERMARLRLIRSHGIGPVGFRRLLQTHGTAITACEALQAKGHELSDPGHIAREMAQVEQAGARYLHLGDADYPPLLSELSDPPPVLIIRGNPGLARKPVVAMVGARNASASGRRLAHDMAEQLGAEGWVVVSGLARGIDAAAHRGSFATGTIACIAGGIDIAYPDEHSELQQAIAAKGLLISEFPPGTEPLARHFPRRNRLIAGIALGLIVIEAAQGSGTLITARYAGDAGREVMAVPGHPSDPRSRGGNALIRDGAMLVENAADVLAVLAPFVLQEVQPSLKLPPNPPRRSLPPIARTEPAPLSAPAPVSGGDDLLDLLSPDGVALDELVRLSGLSAAELQARLVDFELEGLIERLPGGRVARPG